MTFLAGLLVGALTVLALLVVSDVRKFSAMRKEFKIVNARFEAATAELEYHVKRLAREGKSLNLDLDKEKVS